MKKRRIDELLVEHGLAKDIHIARSLIMEGTVVADDHRVDKSGDLIKTDAVIRLKHKIEFVSRGGYKLFSAINEFGILFDNKIVIDIGSSTGGFTDVALRHGATRVYAIDVGVGIIHNKLRNDDRVKLLEGCNFRNLDFQQINELADIIVADLSFISLSVIIPKVREFIKSGGIFISLIKPQFEADRDDIGDGGIVRDEHVRLKAVDKIINIAEQNGFFKIGVMQSPITGAKGNIEFLACFRFTDI